MARPLARLLVAEPDRLQLQLIDMLLASDKFELTMVESGAEALTFLKEHSPDLALLATDLPDVSGDDICGKIRRVTRLSKMPVILVSPQDGQLGLSDTIRARARRVGADLVLPRPLGDKNLRERVQSLLDRRHTVPERNAASTQIIEDALADLQDPTAHSDHDEGAEPSEPVRPLDDDGQELRQDDPALQRFLEDQARWRAWKEERDRARERGEAVDALSGADDGPAGGDERRTEERRTEEPREGAFGRRVAGRTSDAGARDDANEGASDGNESAASRPTSSASTPMVGRGGQAHEDRPLGSGSSPPPGFANVARELESLRIENRQLRRKLAERSKALQDGVDPKLTKRLEELERGNEALRQELRRLKGEAPDDEDRGGGGWFKRRRS